MAKFNPAGPVHLMMRGPSADERIAQARRAQYLTCTTLDDVPLAARLHREAGVPYSVARIWAFEPHPNTDDAAAIRAYARARYDDLRNLRAAAGSPNVLFQVNNEQGFRRDDFIMYRHLIEFAMADPDGPVGMVFWNGATGVVRNGFWNGHGTQYVHEENGWASTWALDFLYAMHEVRDVRLPSGAYAFCLGTHMYSTYYPLIAVNAGQHRKAMRERWDAQYVNAWDAHNAFLFGQRFVDWRLPQDHIGRDVQAIRYALEWEASADGRRMQPGDRTHIGGGVYVDCPHMLVTECGPDAMNDVVPVHLDQYVPSAFSAQQDGLGGRAEGSTCDTAGSEAAPAPDIRRDLESAQMRSIAYALGLRIHPDALEDSSIEAMVVAAKAQAADALSAAGPRGYKTLINTWAQPSWFAGQPAGVVLAYWHEWAWRCVLEPTGVVVGMQPFCLGDTGGWEGFNVAGDNDYMQAMEGWRVTVPDHWLGGDGTVPIQTCRDVVAELQNMGSSKTLTIRDKTSTTGKPLGAIANGDLICVWPPVKGDPVGTVGDLWVPVRRYANSGSPQVDGFAHAHYLKLPSFDPETPEPGPGIPHVKAEAVAALNNLRGQVDTLIDEAIGRIEAL